MPFSGIELSLNVTKASVNVAGDETDIEYISLTTQHAEARIISTFSHSYARSLILISKMLLLNYLQKKAIVRYKVSTA